MHPVIDYSNVINHPILGGEFSYKTNFTSLTRNDAVFDPITTAANTNGLCLAASADPLSAIMPAQLPAARHARHLYARLTAEAQWRRSFTDSVGRDLDAVRQRPRRRASMPTSRTSRAFRTSFPSATPSALRVMPTVGLEYRYPFINVQPWGTTTIEPIAQVIVRPNETYAGKLPNEDAQSMMFDASNLFSVDKFSG